ncbi:Similar to ORF1: Nucleic-acid-binding protein from transposon X-element (Drosophila melanogaster) [Cotesia congregata]|uniref:Similar to ORF1: Nucleic-acid-binding protein from transposon X-element (Drosophila melanogaster) n=1 Tax=Cotesia congregata TaxID=51543 RepID=A0A8J2HEW1_COTCN|nr:Similar to ORF1: Nucleic-acid-binding protein from transposon X-element (Drosophila melanogaster) [Cotesia congregata]
METDYGIDETNEQLKSTQDTTDNASQNTETTNAKTYRPPPIFVQGEKAIDTIQALRIANIDQETFSITMSKGQHQLLAKNQLSFEKIKVVLIANNFNFYSFTPKSEKLKSLLLKSMSPDVTTDMVFKDLTEKNIPSVVFKKVSELKFMRDDEPRRHLIVQRLRRNRALQCRKCQRLGHTAANCQMEYRCVRCGDSSHAPAQCPLKDEKTRDKFKCANCGKNGHPASYAGCRFMKFEKISRNQARAQKNKSLERNIEAIYREVTPQISFANAMSPSRDPFPPLKHRNQTNFQTFQEGPPPPPVIENTRSQAFRLQPEYHQQQSQWPRDENPQQQNWANITNQISELTNVIKEMSININRSINENTRKINFLFAYFNNTDSNKKIFVISSYATNSNRKTFIQELDDVLQRLDLSNADHFFILAGDLNTRRMEWGDTADNQRGKFLRTWEAESIDAYRSSIYTTDVASFKTGSFLDVCISNITLTGLTSKNKITTAYYDSDHRALLFTAILSHEVQTGADIQIPWRNLQEIDDGITNLTSALVNTINKTAPIVKKNEGILKYINAKIKKLQKNKTKAINLLHVSINSTSPNKLELIQKTKHTINLIKSELRKEFNKSVEDYWKGQLKQINHKDPTSFFPKINRFLRKKNRISIADQRIKINDPVCQSGAIDVIKAIKIEDELLITEPIDKLNVIGEFYQTINAPRYLNTGTKLKELIDKKAGEAKELLSTRRSEDTTITNFSKDNRALNPANDGLIIPNHLNNKKSNSSAQTQKEHPFVTYDQLTKILRKLPNKTSKGLQQGTVNSPLLFNIFTMALLQLFNLNIKENLFAVAYADDIIVGVAGKNPPKLQNELEKLVNNINDYYKIWNLRMNPEKCEIAVFRRESNHLSKKALTQIKDFQISTPSPNTNEMIKIPHKTVVKYLGVHIDQLLRIR